VKDKKALSQAADVLFENIGLMFPSMSNGKT